MSVHFLQFIREIQRKCVARKPLDKTGQFRCELHFVNWPMNQISPLRLKSGSFALFLEEHIKEALCLFLFVGAVPLIKA